MRVEGGSANRPTTRLGKAQENLERSIGLQGKKGIKKKEKVIPISTSAGLPGGTIRIESQTSIPGAGESWEKGDEWRNSQTGGVWK